MSRNTMVMAVVLSLGLATTASAEQVTVSVARDGKSARKAVVSFYLLDDGTGEAVIEVTMEAVEKQGKTRTATFMGPEDMKDAQYRAALRVAARKAVGTVTVWGFKTSTGIKHMSDNEDIQGQTRWYAAGDESGEGTDVVEPVPLDVQTLPMPMDTK
jgi:hypothetical protein